MQYRQKNVRTDKCCIVLASATINPCGMRSCSICASRGQRPKVRGCAAPPRNPVSVFLRSSRWSAPMDPVRPAGCGPSRIRYASLRIPMETRRVPSPSSLHSLLVKPWRSPRALKWNLIPPGGTCVRASLIACFDTRWNSYGSRTAFFPTQWDTKHFATSPVGGRGVLWNVALIAQSISLRNSRSSRAMVDSPPFPPTLP